MNTKLFDIGSILIGVIILVAGALGFFGGRASKPDKPEIVQYIDNSTNVNISQSYAASLSSSQSSSIAVALPQSNVVIEYDFGFSNIVYVLTNSETNSYGYFVTNEIYKTNKE